MPQTAIPTVIVTGASSGVGLHAAKALVDRGWRVVMACRDLAKAEAAAQSLGIAPGRIVLEQIDLGAQASAREPVVGYQHGDGGGLERFSISLGHTRKS